MALLDGLKAKLADLILGKLVKKAAMVGAKALVALLASAKVAAVLQAAGIAVQVDPDVLAGTLTFLIAGGLEAARGLAKRVIPGADKLL
jgi:hypothetical protein